ncbi:hypothetical protein bthur0009_6860 [Bacillus thuringiensis serovar andalousiensis BGSC 4AW1]|nr:hypothetical protein BAMEG_3771 [Bacillus anthracis str. CDC 684]ACQ47483.1 hypothetical protein BAA_0895 [Bacillus anthracis str. A0248]EDR16660.1 hypothetical protein BAC_0831 [Bacillus anthracis str. A0488]EDR91395.1 hypothetical protein BAH_0856 [Bacillus anthracis str. A0442]EDS94721.1 hypothetical protein BAK_0888 [Bacillus anthracis str. A0389]EDV14000.1 hypothetical protein BATI_0862 [Bacillus anthracis str. Tsiankovskii-I]EEM73250.1 hypothetical protein bthur0009_6860 [Bacillus th
MHFPTYFFNFHQKIYDELADAFFDIQPNITFLKSVIFLQKYDLQKIKTNKIQLFL